MSDVSAPSGANNVNLIAALGTGATAAVVLWMFINFSHEQGVRQDAAGVETRRQLLDMAHENRDLLENLIRRQTEALNQNAMALEKLSVAVERVNVGVDGISKLGFGQVIGAIRQATQATERASEAAKSEVKH